ncbi:ArsR/SmtB family transcription factor [Streptomyces sp. NPDC000133]|uniref:ArsR/SmtB family transcription factor n=1 Tax=Streptomyces sp. NPDC000133 TaxID=3364535 RepID=UPI0036B6F905
MSTRAGGGFDSPSAEVPAAAAAFGLLATPARLHIVWALSQGESDASGLTELMGGTFPSASRHLTKPRSAGLVRSRREGRRQVYVVDDPHVVTVVRLMVGRLAARAGNAAAQRPRSVTSVPESGAAAGCGRTGPG